MTKEELTTALNSMSEDDRKALLANLQAKPEVKAVEAAKKNDTPDPNGGLIMTSVKDIKAATKDDRSTNDKIVDLLAACGKVAAISACGVAAVILTAKAIEALWPSTPAVTSDNV